MNGLESQRRFRKIIVLLSPTNGRFHLVPNPIEFDSVTVCTCHVKALTLVWLVLRWLRLGVIKGIIRYLTQLTKFKISKLIQIYLVLKSTK